MIGGHIWMTWDDNLSKRADLRASLREQISSTLTLLMLHVLARVNPECYLIASTFQPFCFVQILFTSQFRISTFP